MLLMARAEVSADVLTANPLTVNSFAVTPGEPAELVMYYNTDVEYIGLQFELTLPEGITFAKDPDDETEVDIPETNTKLTKTHFLTAKVHDDGLYKAVFVSMRNDVIKSGSWLLKIPIVVSAEFSGSGTGSIKGCRYATTDHEDQYLDPEYFDIYVAPTAIRLSDSTLELKPGDTATLTATCEPATAAVLPLTWTTSDAAVAAVDAEGNVSALTKGKAIITVALADNPAIAATCEVNVIEPAALVAPTADDPTDTAVYDLCGRRISGRGLPHGGIVIMKSPGGTRKVLRR